MIPTGRHIGIRQRGYRFIGTAGKVKGPDVTGATRRRGHRPDPSGRGRTDRGFMAALLVDVGSARPVSETGRRRRRPNRVSRDQSGDVDGGTESDRGSPLVSRSREP